jgi:hypothetical protein
MRQGEGAPGGQTPHTPQAARRHPCLLPYSLLAPDTVCLPHKRRQQGAGALNRAEGRCQPLGRSLFPVVCSLCCWAMVPSDAGRAAGRRSSHACWPCVQVAPTKSSATGIRQNTHIHIYTCCVVVLREPGDQCLAVCMRHPCQRHQTVLAVCVSPVTRRVSAPHPGGATGASPDAAGSHKQVGRCMPLWLLPPPLQ